ncbi:polysaccharide deacetylase family protein [Rhodoplanes sp. Z2-YC6860]|uniref:polysaccharide deacetylase family protein n=1 Tax=Rhodoplanes sp. Z2-YC6860 TaxID=674703 RepID=UPI00078CD424|nr:polysaccharide deacetylase family protein [Rhodoplanes sp. Z2-YC6860]AMN42257.1 xylanase/chitin deacetylase [Rhodoplanes sp. Z2-YC6860]
MSGLRYTLFRGVLNALYFSGAHWMLKPVVGGAGAILMLHNVRPARHDRFQPNRLLEVTPHFFERVIKRLRKSKVDLISLDEMHRRLVSNEFPRRFVCITFDDGYRDNHEFAYPVLKKYEVPFAIYVATSFADRVGELWWLALEAVIAQNELVGIRLDGSDRWFEARSIAEKRAVYDHIYGWLRQLPTEAELRRVMRELTTRHRVDMASFCNELCMDWKELAEFAADSLLTIGAHTVNHPILTKLDDKSVRAELENSRAVIEAALGVRPKHLAYPVGDNTAAGPREFKIAADLGFATAVTTRPGVIFPQHSRHLTALPRISLNGNFQSTRYAKVLISGAATAINNRFRPVNVT